MKKILSTLLLASILSQPAQAITGEQVKQYLIDYGVPCLLSFGAGMILAKDSNVGMTAGGVGCIAVGGATYLQERREKAQKLSQEQLQQVQAMIDVSSKHEGERLSAVEQAQKKQIEDMKAVLREVIAERILSMEGDMKEYLSKKLESGELMPKIEANLRSAMKKEVVSEVRSYQKELVERCVEETIKEVISKPIGVPQNPTGVE